MRLFNIDVPFRIKGIYTALEMIWDSKRTFVGESHDFWEIVTVVSGQVEVVEDDRCYILEGGMTVCHAPGEFHRIRSAGGTSPHFIVLTFEHTGEIPKGFGSGVFTLDEGEMVEYLSMAETLIAYFKESAAAVKSGMEVRGAEAAETDAVLRLERFILAMSQRGATEGRRSMSSGAGEYRALVRLMTDKVRENLTLRDIAAARHISESYVKKLFHRYAGEGAMSYYARLRTAEIKRMLDGGDTVSTAAEKMGFSSSSYLSTFFKKQTGQTPGEYVRGR